MTRRETRIAACAFAAALALSAAACAPARTSAPSSASSSAPPSAPRQLQAADLTLMSPERKRAEIASSFPMQVPVPQGTVMRGEAQGDSAWDYQVIVKGSPYAVAAWYHIAYSRAEWQITASDENNGAVTMDLRKGDAQSRIVVEPSGADSSKVTATVGVGTPVLQTQ